MSGLATSSPDPVHIQVAPAASPVALQGGAVTSGASPSGLHGARARGAAGLETVDLGASESRSQAPASSAAAAAAAPAAPGRSKKSKDKGRSAKQQPGVTAGAPAQSVSGSPPSARGSLPLSEPPVEAALDAADEAMVEAWKRQQDTITASIQKEHARKAKKQGKDLDHSLAALQRGAAASASSAAAAGGRSGAQTGAGAAAGAGAWAGAGAGTPDEAAFTDIATAMEAGAGSAGFYSTGGGVGANEDCVLRAARVLEQSLEQETDRTLLAATRTSRIALALTLLGTLIVGIAGLAVAAAGERTAFVFGGTRFANAALFLASSLAFPVLLLGAYADWRIHLRLVLVTALVALAAGSLAALGMIFSFSFSQDSLRSAVLTAYAQLGTEEVGLPSRRSARGPLIVSYCIGLPAVVYRPYTLMLVRHSHSVPFPLSPRSEGSMGLRGEAARRDAPGPRPRRGHAGLRRRSAASSGRRGVQAAPQSWCAFVWAASSCQGPRGHVCEQGAEETREREVGRSDGPLVFLASFAPLLALYSLAISPRLGDVIRTPPFRLPSLPPAAQVCAAAAAGRDRALSLPLRPPPAWARGRCRRRRRRRR